MMRFPRCLLSAALVSLLVLAAGPNAKATILFDFEDQSDGSFASISSTQGGLTATLYKPDTTTIDVVGPLGPASWLDHSLISFYSSGGPIVIDFSAPVEGVSIQYGDYNQDDDELIMEAFSGPGGTGTSYGTLWVFYPNTKNILNGDSDVHSFGMFASGIMSVVLSSSGSNAMSIYWDNLSVETSSVPVPEPSALCSGLIGLGLGGLYFWRRRKTA